MEQDARQQVADAGLRLLRTGLVARTWGNVSCRTGADTFVITPSGLGYEGMTAADVICFDMRDGSYSGPRKPSSEKGVHAAAYRMLPDANFVIHTHQTYATALGLAGYEALALSEADERALGGLGRAGYGLPGTKTLVRAVERTLSGSAHTVLMAHHGALFAGRDAEEAFARAWRLEELCKQACRGQPEEETGRSDTLAALSARAAEAFGHAAHTDAPAVIEASKAGKGVTAQLDDAAQMIGRRLLSVPADGALAALQTRGAVLVRELGAVCRASTEGDAHALRLLVEKTCVCFLHARACGEKAQLSPWDAALMRRVYLVKYQKKIGG